MKFYWVKTNKLIKAIFRKYTWDWSNDENKAYLTFDDGPEPKVTPWVLDLLKQHGIKATFFCIGDNIRKHPELFKRILDEGHAVGNHTFNHLNGWKTQRENYLENIRECERHMLENGQAETAQKLFRPPYGKITSAQAAKVLEAGYKIIMWDVLTVDYDRAVAKEKCLENATQKTAPGSIIVFHDSLKAFPNLEYALPKTIGALKKRGFLFDRLA